MMGNNFIGLKKAILFVGICGNALGMSAQEKPWEMINLVSDPKHAKALQACRSQLMEWATKNNDPYLTKLIK